MHKYKFIAKKGEGTFSEVIKAQTASNKYVAIKRMKNHFDSIEQVNNLREVQALKRLAPHPGIIKLIEVIFERSTGRLSLVFELMDMNIFELIRGRRHFLPEKKVKFYMYQLLKAMDHIHRNGIFHRDIKPENILIADDKLKIADFGSCRGVKSKQPFTEYISTRWYRAPECLLTDGYYNYKMDMWGVGCVFFEVMSLFPLFPGTNELDQIQKIHNILGSPPAELLAKMRRSTHMNFNFPQKEGTGIDRLIPNASAECIELIKKLLAYNPEERLSARQALRHPYFKDLREAEKRSKLGAPLYTIVSSADAIGNNNAAADTDAKKKVTQTSSINNIPHDDGKKLPALTKKTTVSVSAKDLLEPHTNGTNGVSHFGSTYQSTYNSNGGSNRSSFELSDGSSPIKEKAIEKKNPFAMTTLKPKTHELELNVEPKDKHLNANHNNSFHNLHSIHNSLPAITVPKKGESASISLYR